MTPFEGHNKTPADGAAPESADQDPRELASRRLVEAYDKAVQAQDAGADEHPVLRLRGVEQDVRAVCDMVACQAEVDHEVARQVLEKLRGENETQNTDKINFLYEVVAAKLEETLRRREEFAEMLAELQHQFPVLAEELRKRFPDIDAVYARSEESFKHTVAYKKAA
ncbi:MAG: hypothetical protein WD049_08020 [Candidatus Paceibacterota bacterium]